MAFYEFIKFRWTGSIAKERIGAGQSHPLRGAHRGGTMKLEREWVEELIFGTELLRRFTQDSPVLPDVWLGYAENLGAQLDLLLTPYREGSTGELGLKLQERLLQERQTTFWQRRHGGQAAAASSAQIAYNRSNVVVRLYFDELIRVVLPLSPWLARLTGRYDLLSLLHQVAARDDFKEMFRSSAHPETVPPELIWMIRLIGSMEVALEEKPAEEAWDDLNEKMRLSWWQRIQENPKRMVEAVISLMTGLQGAQPEKPLLWSVSRNRKVFLSVSRSVPAIKADAASRLFNISCKDLTWAVIDSGIDATHQAFRQKKRGGDFYETPFAETDGTWKNQTRIVATYDFSLIRHLLSFNGEDDENISPDLRARLQTDHDLAEDLRKSISSGREIDWALLEPFMRIPHEDQKYVAPVHEHGTHVAGILAGDSPGEKAIIGVCPDINLYDLRVLDEKGEGDEFSVIAALQFIRHLNAHKDFLVVKGVNLSLSIRHDVANFACGRTPVCEECERLVSAGIVVVAAAGNQGYLQYVTSKGLEEGYRSISITDPGNADGVITVGATHRHQPHTYGVSYFSSRGPTGDGRIKPDLVAPGEKIKSAVPGNGIKRMDGTSMATPHVSGAAALLIARHAELRGQPRAVKQILCDTATDLGRERYFQGSGMLDVLRALQSV
jgi:serine protease AprX